MPDDTDLEAYAAGWDRAARQAQDSLELDALLWDIDAALLGNPVAQVSVRRTGHRRRIERLVARAADQLPAMREREAC